MTAPQGLWRKLTSQARAAGYEVVRRALELHYLMRDPAVPKPAKAAIAAALAYFIAPIDAVPDLIPGLGYTDDLAVLAAALASVAAYRTPEIRARAERAARGYLG